MPLPQISYMEKDMEQGVVAVLCTKIDGQAGDWPSESFLRLFNTAKKCVEPKMTPRPEVADVSSH